MALALAVVVPLLLAARSPLLAWREPIYIAAGLVGVLAMALLLVQPLMAQGSLPGLGVGLGRSVHRWLGVAIFVGVLAHVLGLWITSPPDVIDALLFVSPTAFSVWGVLAMWAVFATAMLALFRTRLSPGAWRLAHLTLAGVIAIGTVFHVLQITGTMEWWSKVALSLLVLAATGKVIYDAALRRTLRRTLRRLTRRGAAGARSR
ncbi:MAG: ferric reductase-like transmembrane domain-containing protein [Pseudomonadota bacterium]